MFNFETPLVLFQLTLIMAVDGSSDSRKIGRLTGSLYVYVGEMLNLFCVMEVPEYTAHNISFSATFRNEKNAAGECLDMRYVHIHNASTAALSIPNLNVNKTGIAQFSCSVGSRCSGADLTNYEVLVDSVNVTIEYRPQNIMNFTCVVFNWESLNCTWRHPVKYNVHHNDTRVLLWFNSDASIPYYCICPQQRFDGCFWPSITVSLFFEFVVNVNNSFTGDAATSYFEVEAFAIVKPAPVEHLSVTKDYNNTGCYLLSWHHSKEFQKVFRVFQKIKGNTDLELRRDNISNMSITLWGLSPNTLYTFCVVSYPGGGFSGYWSDQTCIDYYTPEEAPSLGPEITDGSYSYNFSEACIKDFLSVTIYWTEVNEFARNGVIINYVIKHFGRVLTEVENSSYSANVVVLCSKLPVNLEIVAVNSVGESKNSSIIKVAPLSFQASFQTKQFFVITLNGNDMKPKAFWNQTDQNSSYTVFWCMENTVSPCKGPIHWMHVPKSQLFLDVPLQSSNAMYYNFGIARRDHNSGLTSGIHWTNCMFYSQPYSLPSPAILYVKPDTESFVIFWQKISCTKKSLVFLTGYRVMWCPKHKCDDTSSIQTIDLAATYSSFKVSRLESNTIYKVAVLSKVHDQLGPEPVWKEVTLKPPGNMSLTIFASVIAVIIVVFNIVAWMLYRQCQISRKRTKELLIVDSHPRIEKKDERNIEIVSVSLSDISDTSNSRHDLNTKAKKGKMPQPIYRSKTDLNESHGFFGGVSTGQPGISLKSISIDQSQDPVPFYIRISAN